MAGHGLLLPDLGTDKIPISLSLSQLVFATVAIGVLITVHVCILDLPNFVYQSHSHPGLQVLSPGRVGDFEAAISD